MGEPPKESPNADRSSVAVDTFDGRIHVEWDPQAAVTPLGQLPFFINFLKTADLYRPWVEECPLKYRSNNAPKKVDMLGTLMLSTLAGHRRYSHITSIRCDTVNPKLLGMTNVVSEDSARKAFQGADEEACVKWLQAHLQRCYEPLLYEEWILDVDFTVKPLYGHQEGAVRGYNPHKPGRPSHVYHTCMAANIRLLLDVDVQPGNQTASSYAQPGLWSFLDRLPRAAWPSFLRGDCAWGNENVMVEAESRKLAYLFKLRKTTKVKSLIEKAFSRTDWVDVGADWQGVEAELKLTGWTKKRRVAVLRREIKDERVVQSTTEGKQESPQGDQLEFVYVATLEPVRKYEYAVLVTSLDDEIVAVAQHYRDRGDAENNFDELKNQWGWGGYTTQDLTRCRIMALINALVYNWWSLFVGLAIPDRHAEAITSRPLLLNAVGKQTRHGNQTTVTVTSTHSKSGQVQRILSFLTEYLSRLKAIAEQLSWEELWRLILSRIFYRFLGGRVLKQPSLLLDSS